MHKDKNITDYSEYLTWEYAQWCQRRDGTLYTIGDGLNCKKGRPVNVNELKNILKERLKSPLSRDEDTGSLVPRGAKGFDMGKAMKFNPYSSAIGAHVQAAPGFLAMSKMDGDPADFYLLKQGGGTYR